MLLGNKYIIGLIDWYSGWPEAFAGPDKFAETVAHLLQEEIIPRYSAPLQIVYIIKKITQTFCRVICNKIS